MVDYCIIDKKEKVLWKTTNHACYLPIFENKDRLQQYYVKSGLLDCHYYNNKSNILRISVVLKDFDKIKQICSEFSKNGLSMSIKEGEDYLNKKCLLLDIPFSKYKSINHLKLATHLTRVFVEGFSTANVLYKALEYKQKYPKSNFLKNVLWMSTKYTSGGHNYLTLHKYLNDYKISIPKKLEDIKKAIKHEQQTQELNNSGFSLFINSVRIVKEYDKDFYNNLDLLTYNYEKLK